MTIYTRPDELVFAENANAGEVVPFPDILRGWGLVFEQTEGKPPMEWFNAILKRQDQAIRYLLQRGVPEWSSTEDYPSGAHVQRAAATYRALLANRDVEPGTSAITWELWGLGIATTAEAQDMTNDTQALTPKKLKDALDFLGMAPAGTEVMFAGPLANIPVGWLLEDGSTISRTTYARLFAAIGTTYGAGNGTTTFALPDARGEFIRAMDNGRGVDPGRALGSAQGDAIRNITGQVGAVYANGVTENIGALQIGLYGDTPAAYGTTGADPGGNYRISLSADLVVPTAAENRPRNVPRHFIIKY